MMAETMAMAEAVFSPLAEVEDAERVLGSDEARRAFVAEVLLGLLAAAADGDMSAPWWPGAPECVLTRRSMAAWRRATGSGDDGAVDLWSRLSAAVEGEIWESMAMMVDASEVVRRAALAVVDWLEWERMAAEVGEGLLSEPGLEDVLDVVAADGTRRALENYFSPWLPAATGRGDDENERGASHE